MQLQLKLSLYTLPLLLTLLGCQSNATPAASTSVWLPSNQPTRIDLPLPEADQTFVFNANPSGTTTLTLYNLSPEVPYSAEVRNSRGGVIASLDSLQHATLAFGPGDALYEVKVKAGDNSRQGALALTVDGVSSNAANISSAPTTDYPASCTLSNGITDNLTIYTAPDVTATPLALLPPNVPLLTDARSSNGWYRVYANDQVGWIDDDYVILSGSCGTQSIYQPVAYNASAILSNECQVRSASGMNVNIRSGPGLNYAVIGALNVGSTLRVTGTSDNSWYQVDTGGQTGWVSGSVTAMNGACAKLPLMAGFAPTATPTPSLPLAPADASAFAFDVDRSSWGNFSERISYPDGDHSDLVLVTITNLVDSLAEFTLTLVCDGPGAEYARWGAPENPSLGCGRSIVLPFTPANNYQYFTVTLPDGSGLASINYTLLVARR